MTFIFLSPVSSWISRSAVWRGVSPSSMWPLGIVQRPLESAISSISMDLGFFGERRKITPPAVGSRTTSLITGRFRRTNFFIPEIGLGLFTTFTLFNLPSFAGFLRRLLALFISQHCAKNTVDELGRIIAAEGFGQLYRLIDGDLWRHAAAEHQLIDADPQNCSVDASYLFYRPLRSHRANNIVYCRLVGINPIDDILNEFFITDRLVVARYIAAKDILQLEFIVAAFPPKILLV